MRVGFDLDGVLAAFDKRFQQLIITITGRDLFGEGFIPREWDYPEAAGYTAAEMEKVWQEITTSPVFWETLPAYPETPKLLSTIHKRESTYRDEIYFITSRPGVHVKAQSERWLRAKNTCNMSRQVEFAPTVLIAEDKDFIAQGLKLEAFIDDKPRHCLSMPPSVRTYLLKQPWNAQQHEACAAEGILLVESVTDMFSDLGW